MGKRLSYDAYFQRFKRMSKIAKSLNIVRRSLHFSPHSLRKTYATLLYKSGMPIKALQIKTRHKSINTLFQHYLFDDELASGYIDQILKSKVNDKNLEED